MMAFLFLKISKWECGQDIYWHVWVLREAPLCFLDVDCVPWPRRFCGIDKHEVESMKDESVRL